MDESTEIILVLLVIPVAILWVLFRSQMAKDRVLEASSARKKWRAWAETLGAELDDDPGDTKMIFKLDGVEIEAHLHTENRVVDASKGRRFTEVYYYTTLIAHSDCPEELAIIVARPALRILPRHRTGIELMKPVELPLAKLETGEASFDAGYEVSTTNEELVGFWLDSETKRTILRDEHYEFNLSRIGAQAARDGPETELESLIRAAEIVSSLATSGSSLLRKLEHLAESLNGRVQSSTNGFGFHPDTVLTFECSAMQVNVSFFEGPSRYDSEARSTTTRVEVRLSRPGAELFAISRSSLPAPFTDLIGLSDGVEPLDEAGFSVVSSHEETTRERLTPKKCRDVIEVDPLSVLVNEEVIESFLEGLCLDANRLKAVAIMVIELGRVASKGAFR